MKLSPTRIRVLKFAIPLLVAVLTVTIALPFTKTKKEIFECQARIWIQPTLPAVNNEEKSSLYLPLMAFFNSPILTAAELLKSDVVLREAVNLMHERFPKNECPTPAEIRTTLSADPVKETDILVIRYSNPNADTAFMVVQGVLDGFIKLNSAQSSGSAARSRIFLENQLKSTKLALERARDELAKFQVNHQTPDLPKQVEAWLKDESDLQGEIHGLEVTLAKKRNRMLFLESRHRTSRPSASTLVVAPQDDLLTQNLKKRIADCQMQLLDLQSRLKDSHPRIIGLKAALDQARQALSDHLAALKDDQSGIVPAVNLSPPDNSMDISDVPDSVAEARATVDELETDLAAKKASLDSISSKLESVPEDQVKYAELARQQETALERFSDFEKRLYTARLVETVASGVTNIQIIDPPRKPDAPAVARTPMAFLLTVILGIGLGVASFFGLQMLDPTSVSIKEIMSLFSLPLSPGSIDVEDAYAEPDLQSALFDRLRFTLMSALGKQKKIVVASTTAGDGKSVVAAGLARSFAGGGSRVILIDANFEHPTLHEYFNQSLAPGLSNYAASGDLSMLLKIPRYATENLMLITAGKIAPGAPFLEAKQIERLFETLEPVCDVLIVDTPATCQTAATLALMQTPLFLLLVVRKQHSLRHALRAFSSQLRQLKRVTGTILVADEEEDSVAAALVRGERREAEPEAGNLEQDIW